MKYGYNLFSIFVSLVKLSPLYQFWLNIAIPVIGIVWLGWTPGALLFCFMIEMVNYWLCNAILLLCFVNGKNNGQKLRQLLAFSFQNLLCLAGFYFAVAYLADGTDPSMETNITMGQIIFIVLLYWLHFVWYLRSIRFKPVLDSSRVIRDVQIRLTCIYFGLFVIIGYVFVFWSNTRVMNYGLVFTMILVKNLADLVLIAVKLGRNKEQAGNRSTEASIK